MDAKKDRRKKHLNVTSEIESESEQYLDAEIDSATDAAYSEPSLTPTPIPSPKSKEVSLAQFKDAVQNGACEQAMDLIQELPDLHLLQTRFDNGDNCLQICIRRQNHRLIVYFLDNGVDPNEQNTETGDTALHTAVRARDVKVVTLLCTKYGADHTVRNKDGELPATIATKNMDEDVAEILKHARVIKERLDNDGADDRSGDSADKDAMNVTLPLKPIESGVSVDEQNETRPARVLKRVESKNAVLALSKVVAEHKDLPLLEAWLSKKSSGKLKKWNQRWVVVRGGFIMWSDRKRDISDAQIKDEKERGKWSKCLNLASLSQIDAVREGKTQRKLKFRAGATSYINRSNSKAKEYVWKCASAEDRDKWVEGIKQHQQHVQDIANYLSCATPGTVTTFNEAMQI